MSTTTVPAYGLGDTSYKAAGGEAGLRRLADAFYDEMETEPLAAKVRGMHPDDLAVSRDKLARFLCGWLNGPNRYREKYGSINLPGAHAHLAIGVAERDAWLLCMQRALETQDYAEAFKAYLLKELSVPANRIVNRED